jgi:hypothetical protein
VGPKAVLDTVVKRKIPRPRQESNPRTGVFVTVIFQKRQYEKKSALLSDKSTSQHGKV